MQHSSQGISLINLQDILHLKNIYNAPKICFIINLALLGCYKHILNVTFVARYVIALDNTTPPPPPNNDILFKTIVANLFFFI